MAEFDVIARYFAPHAGAAGLGLRDDAACFTVPSDHQLVISTDALVSGVHYLSDSSPEVIAQRLVAANVSDLAACGATPAGCVLILGLGARCDDAWLASFSARFCDLLTSYDLPLWGGDTVRCLSGDDGFVALTVHGLVPVGMMLTRSGARVGDDVYVSGVIGGGGLGLRGVLGAAQGVAGAEAYASYRHYYDSPMARLAFGIGLRGCVHSAIDISDGLIADLDHICRASDCSMAIDFETIPYVAGAADVDRLELISAGDDYELAFTASPSCADRIFDLSISASVCVTRIGRVCATDVMRPEVVLYDSSGAMIPLSRRGYQHF